MRKFKLTKALSWYYVFAFFIMFSLVSYSLVVYLYRDFILKENFNPNDKKKNMGMTLEERLKQPNAFQRAQNDPSSIQTIEKRLADPASSQDLAGYLQKGGTIPPDYITTYIEMQKESANTPAPLTTAPLTTSPLTTAPLTTAPLTTAPLTTAPLTTAPLTTAPLTTAPLTTAPLTTAPLTTAPLTTAPLTTAPLTKTPLTTAPSETPPEEDHADDHEDDHDQETPSPSPSPSPWPLNSPSPWSPEPHE